MKKILPLILFLGGCSLMGGTSVKEDTAVPRVVVGDLDLGDVFLGCTTQGKVTVTAGDEPASVEEVVMVDDSGAWNFALDEGANGPLPWRLEPGESRPLGTATFAPLQEGSLAAALMVDLDGGGALPELAGRGVAYGQQTDVFSAEGGRADIVVAVNRAPSMQDDIEMLLDSINLFTDALVERSVDFQLVFTVAEDGCVLGELPWIEGSLSEYQISAASEVMMDPFGTAGVLATQQFELLSLCLQEGNVVPGGCNEGLLREGADLHLVGVSDGDDESAQPWGAYLEQFQLRKGPAWDVVFHGIGCLDDTCATPGFSGFEEASAATGGAMLDLARSRWPDDLPDLAALVQERAGIPVTFVLKETAAPGSVEVTVDGERWSDNWSFDSANNAVVLDFPPNSGAEVSVSYFVVPVCE